MDHLFILEGVDGTGKSTYASEIVKQASWDNVISYIYFPKHKDPYEAILYWNELMTSIKHIKGIILMDRSLISTFVYEFPDSKYELLIRLKRSVDPEKTTILYFSEIYRIESGIDYAIITKRYREYLSLLEKHFRVIYVDE